jgi:HPt (histidine-containing phosphotransfer) domain-containing protein
MSSNYLETDYNRDQTAVLSLGALAPHTVSEIVDMTMLFSLEAAQAEGDPDIIVELIDLYLADAPLRIAAMQAAIAAKDERALSRAAHNLRGSSANLGAHQLGARCADIEQADGHDSFQMSSAFLAQLEQEFGRVRQVFTAERRSRL